MEQSKVKRSVFPKIIFLNEKAKRKYREGYESEKEARRLAMENLEEEQQAKNRDKSERERES